MSNLRQFRSQSREAGFTLAEMLIAMAIFIIASTVAFMLYDNAQRSFKKGEEITEQQQVTRVAFDKMISDLRMAGFNYNPTGNPTITDEQIEGAWDMAVILRGDFDYEDATESTTPETTLATGSPFSVVSTGNDEIVAYVLAENGGALGGETMSFWADESSPRDTTASQIDVPNVALTAQSNPPYTLYRITFDATGDSVKEPLADNIRSLTFTYYDANSTLLDPGAITLAGGETSAARTNRAKIRRITLNVEGMTPNDDVTWTDASDTDVATKHRRKFALESDVQARNLGLIGAPDPDNTPPTTPTGLGACAGHCGGLVLEWTANDPVQSVVLYNIKYGTVPAALSSLTSIGTPPAYLNGLNDASSYYFSIQAEDTSGNVSTWSSTIGPIPLASDTTPEQVQNLSASASGPNVSLSWDATVENTDAGASAAVGGCDPDRPVRRDSGGYQIYRQKNPSGTFNLADAGVVQIAATGNTYTDSGVELCTEYGYRVTAIDAGCSAPLEGLPSDMATVTSSVAAQPAAPTGGAAQLITGNHGQLSWTAVTQDTATPTPNTITIASYNVYHALVDEGLGESAATATFDPIPSAQLSCATPTSCVHNNGGAGTGAGIIRYYKVAAATNCVAPNDEGVLSDPFPLTCAFDGTPVIISPADGAEVTSANISIQINVSGGSSTYTQADVHIEKVGNALEFYDYSDNTYSASSPNFDVTWPAGSASGLYQITAIVTQADGCTRSTSITIDVVTPVTCCLAVTSANVITQGPSKKELRISFDNFCTVDLTVDQFQIQMTSDPVNTNAKMSKAEFDSVGDFFFSGGGEAIEATPYTVGSLAEVLSPGAHTLTLEFKSNISNCSGTNNSFQVDLRYTRPETGATQYTCTFDINSAIVTCI